MRWRIGKRMLQEIDVDHAYASWAPFYPACAHNRLMEVEEHAVRELLPSVSGRAVLDAGCGTGRYLNLLSQAGAADLVGVDRSADMLRFVRTRAARLVRADLRCLPLRDRSVDVVVCGLTLMDVAELDMAIREMARVLAPNGALVYSTLHPAGAAEGWTRTFDTPAGRQVVKSWWHSDEDHVRACLAAGLVVAARREPILGDRSPSGRRPVALVIRADRVR
jgi:malonyl-CoA O-methyltransferase